ncbi:MAG: (2Fe-2S)-binding protein [Bryobacteraceae bacterium]
MPNIRWNGKEIAAQEGATVAAALLGAGVGHFRTSTIGQPRAPLCAMGVCMECRVTIDGHPHSLACQTLCRPGMEVTTP